MRSQNYTFTESDRDINLQNVTSLHQEYIRGCSPFAALQQTWAANGEKAVKPCVHGSYGKSSWKPNALLFFLTPSLSLLITATTDLPVILRSTTSRTQYARKLNTAAFFTSKPRPRARPDESPEIFPTASFTQPANIPPTCLELSNKTPPVYATPCMLSDDLPL